MRRQPEWEVEGADWPNRSASRFVRAGGFDWHVQVMGSGPVLLLVHGTGAATHSWRDVAPALADAFTVVAPDLPGHGFTSRRPGRQCSLPEMAAALAALLSALELSPDGVVGHSAGAAIVLRMVLDAAVAPRTAVSLNGALVPFPGLAAILFPALARLLFLNPLAAPFFTARADAKSVARLMEGTGSRLDPRGLELYRRLLRTERHVEATLGMMAHWDLVPLRRDLPRLAIPLTLVAADRDRAVPPRVAREVASLVPGARVELLTGLGHLAHEEAPGRVSALIRAVCG